MKSLPCADSSQDTHETLRVGSILNSVNPRAFPHQIGVWPFRLARRRLGNLSYRCPRVSVTYTAFLRMSSDFHSHDSRSDAVSNTREPPPGSAPTLGGTVEQYTTEMFALEHRFKKGIGN